MVRYSELNGENITFNGITLQLLLKYRVQRRNFEFFRLCLFVCLMSSALRHSSFVSRIIVNKKHFILKIMLVVFFILLKQNLNFKKNKM